MGEVNFDYLPLSRGGGSEKLKKGMGVWCRDRS